ncbi:MAG: ParB/RepB/Spo0J family partition protein [Sphaerochaetaceae bacterium]|nr:ParB/RepB/Spo0J family partition protein [Sphaerochaetaceae bacterium]
MLNKKYGLGKGINSLINDYSTYEVKKLEETGSKVLDLDITAVKPNPNQPRKTFDPTALSELRDSIISQGVLQPILVEEIADNTYVIIAGERRYRAAKLAGLKTIPAIVRSFSDLQRLEVSLIENIQRENLNPVEEARAYQYLLTQAGIKQEELALKVGKSRPTITNSLRILNLPDKMLDALEKGYFSAGHARAILSVNNPADQEILFNKIIDEDMSVRQAESFASDLNSGKRAVNKLPIAKETDSKVKAPEIQYLEEKFLSATGCKVEIKGKYKNGIIKKGKILIPFTSEEELERIYQIISPGSDLYD